MIVPLDKVFTLFLITSGFIIDEIKPRIITHTYLRLFFKKTMGSTADLLRARFSSEEVKTVTKGPPIKAYLLPSTDAHQSEYLAEHDFRVKFLTGFTGSNAYVAVTNEKAVLWTDGRYFIQPSRTAISEILEVEKVIENISKLANIKMRYSKKLLLM
ncbi:unnamed protein product [Strongylus vulgaris]|uniref:Creatinase N-terminal domain-containing protein n=1 Tax=Strongylus vulgaris TaxID=40348 RepID=A0A3P7I5J7_STRVU|nr:unnamed protein product [Strongylus vulgaris]